jgi:hypothetical protein
MKTLQPPHFTSSFPPPRLPSPCGLHTPSLIHIVQTLPPCTSSTSFCHLHVVPFSPLRQSAASLSLLAHISHALMRLTLTSLRSLHAPCPQWPVILGVFVFPIFFSTTCLTLRTRIAGAGTTGSQTTCSQPHKSHCSFTFISVLIIHPSYIRASADHFTPVLRPSQDNMVQHCNSLNIFEAITMVFAKLFELAPRDTPVTMYFQAHVYNAKTLKLYKTWEAFDL